MEFKFIELETKGLEGDALAFAQSYNKNQKENFEHLASAMESKGIDATEVKKMLADNQEAIKTELAKEAVSMVELKTLENDLLKRINDATKNVIEVKSSSSLVEMVAEKLRSLEIKSAADLRKLKQGFDFELKDAVLTTDYTGYVTRSKVVGDPKFAPVTPNAFLGVPGITGGTVEGGKSVLVWVTGSYTSNAGYVGEGNAASTDDAATGVEKSRLMAKVSAKLPMSVETFEDLPQFAQRLVDQLLRKVNYFVDGEIYAGDGADGGANAQHIYGVKGQATAFDHVGYGAVYSKATILDLIDACSVQAEVAGFKVNTVRLHPKTASKLRRTKDASGQPIVQQLVDGSPSIGGLRLITTSKVAEAEMLVTDDTLIQVWTKRNMDLKVGQFGLDTEKDLYSAILFARYQCLVEDTDKPGVILVADIDTAIASIDAAV